jgi:hypothetical protein
MITHFLEASQGPRGPNHGKFLLLRLDARELETRSALPGFETMPLLAGRKFTGRETFMLDLQTGEGAAFLMTGLAEADLSKHRIWVCPLYLPTLQWLYTRNLGEGAGDITALPRYVELPDAPFAFAAARNPGSQPH